MVESVTTKARDLTLKSPRSKVSTHGTHVLQSYENLKEHAKVSLLEKNCFFHS